MEKRFFLVFFAFLLISAVSAQGWLLFKSAHHPRYERLQTGDIVFQDTGGAQGEAVTAATKSNFTHCGVVFENNGQLYVFEAIQPVTFVPLDVWKARSKVFHARRLKDRTKLTNDSLLKAMAWGERQLGKDYDFKFQWSDDRLYCSELVWKVYHRATGIKICEPKRFMDYDLEDQSVLKIIVQRYGDRGNLPMNELVVAPSDLAASTLLDEVSRKRRKKAL